MENLTYTPGADYVAACGLYCGACHKFTKGQCPGCKSNAKASWCKMRKCCLEHNYNSCADCTLMALEECKHFNHIIGKVFSFIFRSDRPACIRRIKAVGHDAYAQEMHEKGLMAIKK